MCRVPVPEVSWNIIYSKLCSICWIFTFYFRFCLALLTCICKSPNILNKASQIQTFRVQNSKLCWFCEEITYHTMQYVRVWELSDGVGKSFQSEWSQQSAVKQSFFLVLVFLIYLSHLWGNMTFSKLKYWVIILGMTVLPKQYLFVIISTKKIPKYDTFNVHFLFTLTL